MNEGDRIPRVSIRKYTPRNKREGVVFLARARDGAAGLKAGDDVVIRAAGDSIFISAVTPSRKLEPGEIIRKLRLRDKESVCWSVSVANALDDKRKQMIAEGVSNVDAYLLGDNAIEIRLERALASLPRPRLLVAVARFFGLRPLVRRERAS